MYVDIKQTFKLFRWIKCIHVLLVDLDKHVDLLFFKVHDGYREIIYLCILYSGLHVC